MEYVVLPIEIQRSLQGMIANFGFILTMFSKYEKVLSRAKGADGFEIARTLGWTIFIFGRSYILNKRNEIVECACLLVSTLSIVLNQLKGDSKEDISNLRKVLCEAFKMKSEDSVIEMEGIIAKMITEVMGRNITLKEMFEPDRVHLIIKKMNSQYQQRLQLDEIDERIFVVSEMKIKTPSKFMPFARQGMANRLFTPFKPDDTDCAAKRLKTSKRTLTYENNSSTKTNVNFATKLKEIKFEHYPSQSPYTVSKLPAATPITRAMEMNNWLQEHILKCVISENGLSPTLSEFVSYSAIKPLIESLDNILIKLSSALGIEKNQTQIKSSDIKALYFRIIDSLIGIEEKQSAKSDITKLLFNMEFHKGVIVTSTEIMLFVYNSMAIQFEEILGLCEIDPFQFWKLILPFLKFDPMMPTPLKLHFQQIEVKILTFLAWQKNASIHCLLANIIEKEKMEEKKNAIRIENSYCIEDLKVPTEEINNSNPSTRMDTSLVQLYVPSLSDITPAHELFFKRVLQVVASKIISMSEALSITDDLTKEKLWELMKYCLGSETELLIDRHIDQILLCVIYVISKMSNGKFTFNTIISHYIGLYSYASESITSLFFHIRIDDKKYEDIIGFYNHVFISRVRPGICLCCKKAATGKIQPNPLTSNKQKIKALAPESPLNENLPPVNLQYQIGSYSHSFIGNSSSENSRQSNTSLITLTPRTKALYSFGECQVPKVKTVLTPSAISDRKDNYKNSLKSQIVIQKKGLPPIRDPNLGIFH